MINKPALLNIVEFKEEGKGGGSRNRAIRTRQSCLSGERRDIYFPSNGPRATKVLRLASSNFVFIVFPRVLLASIDDNTRNIFISIL